MVNLYAFDDYKQYLGQRLVTQGESRGLRSQLAKKLRCQTAFVSQVLRGTNHFSLEHGVLINEFLDHTSEESDFFMLLVQYGRSGSAKLRSYLKKKIDTTRKEQLQIGSRLKVKQELDQEAKEIYYSSWIYAAVHVLVSIPAYREPRKMAQRLNLPVTKVNEALEFLSKNGLVRNDGEAFSIGEARVHLSPQSPLISKHHANWRLRALSAMEENGQSGTNYSSVITLSKSDAKKVEDILVSALEQKEKILRASKEEEIYCLNVDFFKL